MGTEKEDTPSSGRDHLKERITASCRSGLDSLHSIDDVETASVKVLDAADSEDAVSPGASTKHRAPDGGWGWMIVIGCTVMHFLVGGITRCYSLFYVKLEERFEGSAAVTAWVGGANTAVRMGCSPLATGLASRFGTRRVVIAGGLLISAGLMLSCIAPSIEYLFLSYSLLVGLGGSLVYVPAIVLVGQYFDKRRSIATGVSTAGSGFGMFCMPPIVQLSFQTYGLFGTWLVLGAVSLNHIVSGLLYRPLSKAFMDSIRTPEKDAEKFQTTSETKCTDGEIRSDNVHLVSNGVDKDRDKTRCQIFCTSIQKHVNINLFTDIRFILTALPFGFTVMSYMSAQMLLNALGKECGLSDTKSVMLVSVLGVSDMCGRVSSGFVFNMNSVRKHREYVYCAGMLLCGTIWLTVPVLQTFISLLLVTVFHGVVTGAVVAQRAVIIADMLGVHKLSSGLGFAIFVSGIAVFIGPLVAGALKDITGNYQASYYFAAAASVIASALFLCNLQHRDRHCVRIMKRKEELTVADGSKQT